MANPSEMKPDRRKDQIRRRMERTRTALAEKLEILGDRVRGATEVVESVTGAVQNTVQTVQSVTEQFDVMRHPVLMFAGSVAVGYIGGVLLHRWSSQPPAPVSYPYPTAAAQQSVAAYAPPSPPPQEPSPTLLGQITGALGTEAQKLKRMALGTAVGAVRDMFAPDIPDSVRPLWQDLAKKVAGWLGADLPAGPTFASPNGHSRNEHEEEPVGSAADRLGGAGRSESRTYRPFDGPNP